MSGFTIHRPNPARTEWHCGGQGCEEAAVTGPLSTKVPWHKCSALGGAFVPLTKVGEGARPVEVPREDYVGAELVQRAPDGRVLSGAQIQRPDGSNDAIVYAPTATASADEVRDWA